MQISNSTNTQQALPYLLPLIHTPGNPGRPIVALNGALTERISQFVDCYLCLLVEKNSILPQEYN